MEKYMVSLLISGSMQSIVNMFIKPVHVKFFFETWQEIWAWYFLPSEEEHRDDLWLIILLPVKILPVRPLEDKLEFITYLSDLYSLSHWRTMKACKMNVYICINYIFCKWSKYFKKLKQKINLRVTPKINRPKTPNY